MSNVKLLQSPSVSFWLKKAAHSPRTVKTYLYYLKRFVEATGLDPEAVVSEWQKIRYDYAERQRFLDRYADLIERFYYDKLQAHTPKAKLTCLASILSFFRHNKIPVEVDINERAYVVNHNRAIQKAEILRILDHATLRDRCFFLFMLESGLRPQTIVMLRYKHIKTDFEQSKVPMMIRLESNMLKDCVSARFSFLGQYGFDTLKEYLSSGSLDKKGQVTSRLPLKDDDVIFLAVHTKQQKDAYLSPNLFSLQFAKIVRKLGLQGSEKKEGRFRRELILYTLRKYFRNNIHVSDIAFREFWMGHSLRTDAAYFDSWMEDPNIIEKHRAEYANAYKLIGLRQDLLQEAQVSEDLKKKDQEIAALKQSMTKLQPLIELIENVPTEDLKLYLATWLETEDFWKAREAREAGKRFNRTIRLNLTEEQTARIGEVSDDMSMELSKVLQKAFDVSLEELFAKKRQKS